MARRKHSSRYLSYLRSPAWFALRKQHFARYGEWCKACGSTQKIHLHHKTYENLGRELMSELVALCDLCHRAVHRHHKANPTLTLWQSTDYIIKSRRK
jgi:phage terminase large subunit GpA-like protein